MYTCTKTYTDIPFAHRQHNHDGHCSYIHGHNWSFKFTFGCHKLDDNGFVMDFGKMKFIRDWIDINLDHAFVYNKDDETATQLMGQYSGLFKPYAVDSCSAEGLAKHLFTVFKKQVHDETNTRVYLLSVEVMEDSKNTAKYEKPSV